jgi:cytoskeleton protein RodZ
VFEIGSSLREARLRQELDFPEVEQATKIRARYLRALEEERFETLPAQTYVKGFLRTYAEYLGLDGQLYVDEYNSRFITGEEETPLRARSRSMDGTHDRRLQSKVVLLVIAAIAVITALVIAAWKFGSSDSTPAKTHAAPAAKHHVHRHPAPRARTVRLAVRATRGSGSYVEVRVGSSSGHQLYAGTLLSGQGQHFDGKRLWITVSAPANVVLRVNGARKALPGHGYPRVLVASAGGILKVAPRA